MRQSTLRLLGVSQTGREEDESNKDEVVPNLNERKKNHEKENMEESNDEKLDGLVLEEYEYGGDVSFNEMQTISSEGDRVNSKDSWDDASESEKVEYELHMDSVEGWNMGLSGLQDKEDDIEQVSIEVDRTKKQSWWENINKWFVKKIQTKNAKGSSEHVKEQEEEIIFVETIDIPLQEKNWDSGVLDNANKRTHSRRMVSTPIHTQQSLEIMTNTLAKDEDDIEFDAYIKM